MWGDPTYKVGQTLLIRLVFWVELGLRPYLVAGSCGPGLVRHRLVCEELGALTF
jgi:hypothetical protein